MSLLVVPSFASHKLSKRQFYAPGRLGHVVVERTDSGFLVNNQEVQPQNMDKQLRTLDPIALKAVLKNGYVMVDQSTNGEYKLSLNGRLKGGAIGGAVVGFWIGKVGVYALGYGTISLISACTGPLAKGTFVTLTKFCGPAIEVASTKAGLAGGIALGAATGPV